MSSQLMGKQRNPGVVLLLGFITFGLYFFVWYYKINREVKFHDRTQKFSPGLALCSCFLPIFNLVSYYNTANRIKMMQLADDSKDLISPGAALLWMIFFCFGYPLYIQSALNNHWHRHRTQVISARVSLLEIDASGDDVVEKIEKNHTSTVVGGV